MSDVDRKTVIREYKERIVSRGVFSLTCSVTGHAWVGSSRDLRAARNGVMFSLRQHLHRDRRLQTEWDAHGEAAFTFEEVEILDDDVSSFSIGDLLKEKTRDWATRLGAQTLLP